MEADEGGRKVSGEGCEEEDKEQGETGRRREEGARAGGEGRRLGRRREGRGEGKSANTSGEGGQRKGREWNARRRGEGEEIKDGEEGEQDDWSANAPHAASCRLYSMNVFARRSSRRGSRPCAP